VVSLTFTMFRPTLGAHLSFCLMGVGGFILRSKADDLSSYIYIVAYLLKARTVETEKQPLLRNGRVTRNSGVTVGRVFSLWYVPRLYNEGQLTLRDSLGIAVRRVGSCCEMVASLRRRELGSRGMSIVGRRYQAAQ
jgi:hypothetical protein